MKDKVFKLFNDLKSITNASIIYFQDDKRIKKTFSEFSNDIDKYVRLLYGIKSNHKLDLVGIIGPISYAWALLDMACIKGGFKSVAIPETMSNSDVKSLIIELKVDVVLVDHALINTLDLGPVNFFFYNCNDKKNQLNFDNLVEFKIDLNDNLIQTNYSIGFTSGTSKQIKRINLSFEDLPKTIQRNKKQVIHRLINRLRKFLHGEDKALIYMPFSHIIQRRIFRDFLMNGINIVLTNQNNCLKHIITEKPNILVSSPILFEIMSKSILAKINRFSKFKKYLYVFYNKLNINSLKRTNFLNFLFRKILFDNIKRIYGGRADLFVAGGADLSIETQKLFLSVGVKVHKYYGLSEIGVLCGTQDNSFKLGSVGKPNNIKISENSEILVKYNKIFYHNSHILKINDGYVFTGDRGYIDKDGFLFVLGRLDDIILLKNGKKIYPAKLENLLVKYIYIINSVVFTRDKRKLSVVIDTNNNLKVKDEIIKRIIKKINKELSNYEKIYYYFVVSESFSVSDNTLTNSLKVKRESVIDKYKNSNFHQVY